jgi:hypothetical protein
MLQKLATLLAFDFEGAVRLKEWESLVEIIRKTAERKNVRILQGMADCLLRSDAPVKGQIPLSLVPFRPSRPFFTPNRAI